LPTATDLLPMRTSWKADITAGLTVGIVALPLALAFGVTSGVGAAAGLVTAVIAGFVAAVFGGSHVQVSGPTGAMAVVLAPIVASHGAASVGTIALIAGIILVVASALRLGQIINLIPWPVIEGFTAGIAIIIFLQQVPAAISVAPEIGQNAAVAAWNGMTQAVRSGSSDVLWTVAIAAVVAATMIVSRRIHPSIPGSLIGVIAATVFAALAGAPVARIGALPDSLPAPSMPPISLDSMDTLFTAALAVAALAGIESLLSIKVAASMADTGIPEPNRELFGQGLASVAAGVFGGMPATGAIARTAVNINAGGRSRLAAVIHAALLLAVVYLLAPAVSLIPLSALAGVLMVVTVGMIDLGAARAIFTSSRSGAFIYLVTAAVTVSFDLIEAVEIGVVVAAFFALRAVAMNSVARREQLPGVAQPGDERIALYRLDGSLFFGAADRVLDQVQDGSDSEVIVLRMSQVSFLDATGARKLAELVTTLERRGVTVLVKGIRDAHMKLATQAGLVGSLRHPNHLFDDLDSAVAHARSHIARGASGPPESAGSAQQPG
jgi:SulP family sulfate permease